MMEDLLIKKKVDDLTHYLYVAMKNFPKFERHVMSAEIRNLLFRIDEHVIRAQRKFHKTTTLQDLDIAVACLYSKIRLAHKLAYFSVKQYEIACRMILEIGRMVGGWMKSAGK